ncbi:phage holin family protein [Salmonirosea aquatica]|uniref:Phage holin family protein n=1 Tax=Salmonirosea aquatica TaxID=2654236 RepID=A0A7C9FXF5_9BACT|nr:hypothetical protein [Cytophagaceae bacterium SJW1-29]
MIFKEAKQKAEQTYQHLIDYAEARWNVIALEVSDHTATIATSVVMGICLGLLGLFFLFFISTALALWLADLLHSYALGFLLVSVLYGIIGVIVYANRKRWLFLPFMDKFLKILYRKQNDKIV